MPLKGEKPYPAERVPEEKNPLRLSVCQEKHLKWLMLTRNKETITRSISIPSVYSHIQPEDFSLSYNPMCIYHDFSLSRVKNLSINCAYCHTL